MFEIPQLESPLDGEEYTLIEETVDKNEVTDSFPTTTSSHPARQTVSSGTTPDATTSRSPDSTTFKKIKRWQPRLADFLSKFRTVEITLFGKQIDVLYLVIMVALLGVVAYPFIRFLFPSQISIVSAENVESFEAIAGIQRSKLGKFQPGGNGSLIVTRATPDGSFVLVELEITHGYLSKRFPDAEHGYSMRDSHITIESSSGEIDFLLAEPSPNPKRFSLNFSLLMGMGLGIGMGGGGGITIPGNKLDFQARGKLTCGKVTVQTGGTQSTESDEEMRGIGGKFHFVSDSGMMVASKFTEEELTVTWDHGSRGIVTLQVAGTPYNYFDFSRWKVPILIRRPEEGGKVTIRIFEDQTLTINVR